LPSEEKAQAYPRNHSPSEIPDYTLWKATKKTETTARNFFSYYETTNSYRARMDQKKTDTFAEYLVKVFGPNIREMGAEEEEVVFDRQEATQCQTIETKTLTKSEVRVTISKHLNAKKLQNTT
jgi:hypothetical protein